jgi:hypothetical protein
MAQEIPLIAQVAQSIKIVLDEQACEIQIRERLGNLYMSMVVDGVESWNNYVCYDRQNIKPFTYMPLKGGLYFIDIEGSSDPVAAGLNTRFFLIYLSEGESLPVGFVDNAS